MLPSVSLRIMLVVMRGAGIGPLATYLVSDSYIYTVQMTADGSSSVEELRAQIAELQARQKRSDRRRAGGK